MSPRPFCIGVPVEAENPAKKPRKPRKKETKPRKPPRKRRSKAERIARGIVGTFQGSVTKCTDEIIEKICLHVRRGSWMEIAAEAEGVHPTTLRTWLQKGADYIEADEAESDARIPNQNHKIFRDLVINLNKAAAEGELLDLKRLNRFARLEANALIHKMRAKTQYRENSSWNVTQKKDVTTTKKVEQQAPGISVDQLNLPLEVRIQILKALKEREKEQKEAQKALPAPIDVEFTEKTTETPKEEEKT